MSDPLATNPQALSAINSQRHILQYPSESHIRSKVPVVAREQEKISQRLVKSGLDLVLFRGIKVPPQYCRDPIVQKQLEGKKRESVMCSSDTSGLNVRHSVPRLVCTAQEMYDAAPPNFGSFPFSLAGIVKSAKEKAMLGGGTQYTLNRLIAYGPKRVRPARPFEAAEVVAAMLKTGRKLQESPEMVPAALREEEVRVNAESDNGFPVGGNMKDPEAQHVVLQLAGKIRTAMQTAVGGPQAGFEDIRDRFPEFVLCKGKTKTDVYKIGKATAESLRFYNVVPRQLCILIQSASQPLSDAWKKNAEKNWCTGIGKGFALGRADEFITWLDGDLEAQLESADTAMSWSHTGDDTFVARVTGGALELFTLDCTSFDITQHSETTQWVHRLVSQQLKAVDAVAGTIWANLAQERLVTVFGSVVAKTKHWGPSGMPLQSEVNDILMECLLARLSKEQWTGKERLAEIIEKLAGEVGFSVRLETYTTHSVKAGGSVRSSLELRPQLYLGYYLYARDGVVKAVMDLPRFLSGMVYLTSGYVSSKSEVGPLVALSLAGYTLSFGVPPDSWQPMFEVLQERAIGALDAVGHMLSDDAVEAEVRKHVFAGLPDIQSVTGLKEAVRRDPAVVWLGGVENEVRSLGAWGDEPWLKEVPKMPPPTDLMLNQPRPAQPNLAGTLPPLSDRDQAARAARRLERERRKQLRESAREERKARGARSKGGALIGNPFYDDEESEHSSEGEASVDSLDEESSESQWETYEPLLFESRGGGKEHQAGRYRALVRGE